MAGSSEHIAPPAGTTEGLTTLALEVSDPGGRLGSDERAWLTSRLAEAGAALGASGEVRLRLVGDEEMDQAHRRYCGVPGTTDVLTFDEREAADGPLDVDLLVCVDEAGRQAKSRGHTRAREALLYAIHGMLHCLGEDDTTDEAAARMHAREDRVLSAIGVGETYARVAGVEGVGAGATGAREGEAR